jgi:uncharacterized protein YndB with AHSA1/START domain
MATAPDLIPAPGVVDLSFRRLLPAPRAQVWAAWTEAARFAQWFGPHGSRVDPCEVDARVGGRLFFCHRHLDYPDVWVLGEYTEVVPLERLAFTVGFADPDGRPRARDNFAEQSRIEVVLRDHDAGTEMRIRHTGLSSDQGESVGWRQSLERLDSLFPTDPA